MMNYRLSEINSWGITENLCMVAAFMPMMNEEQWEYCTLGNTKDVRVVFKDALGSMILLRMAFLPRICSGFYHTL